MDKAAIRNFAIWARNKLISDVAYRAGLMGITADGIADKLPQSTNSVQFYDIGTSEPYQITGKEIAQRSNLAFLIKRKANSSDYATAYTSIIEEVAYTWFNRLIAVRFMEVNDYLPSHVRVLSSESGKIEPDIVTNPFDVDLGITEKESSKILELKQNNESDELFKLLFIKQCNKLSEILPRLFEKTDDYTELLFNCSYVDQEGIVYRLTHDISEEDFDVNRGGQVEIIGWLYQYYNAELKDDTFALLKKNVKISKERIPSATQLFTPDWIVRYMVENSLGRLWTEGHANTSSQLRSNWKYYLDEAEQEPATQVQLNDIRKEYTKLRPEELRIIDPCMGSGHILVYAFDVLVQIYESEGYSQRDASVLILENNIFGLDIDDRAAQLAYFAVMMKARQYNRRILDGSHDCHVLAIRESNGMSTMQTYMAPFGDLKDAALRLVNAYNDAKEYGSILNIPLTLEEIDALGRRIKEINDNRSEDVEELMVEALVLSEFPSLLAQARIMVQKYDVVVTNPPYMNGSGMSNKLSEYVKKNYSDEKADLYSCCMRKGLNLVKPNRFMSMITMEGWMFINSLKEFRSSLLSNYTIQSLVHMPYLGKGGTSLGINFGTSAFVVVKEDLPMFLAEYNYIRYYELDDKMVPITFPLNNERRSWKSKRSFFQIPNKTVSYWASEAIIKSYSEKKIGDFAISDGQTKTGNNDKFLRCTWEIDSNNIGKNKKWAMLAKGGVYRKWYGNKDYLIDWSEQARRHYKEDHVARIAPEYIWFREGVSWNHVTSNERFSARILNADMLFETAAPSVFFSEEELLIYIIAFLNTKVAESLIRLVNPTMCTNVGDITCQPLISDPQIQEKVDLISRDCIAISKNDWDSFETSYDFKKHPLL